MATTTIPWNDGSGDNITLTYTSASGSQTVSVSSDANTGLSARMKNITFTSGVGSIARVLTVLQESNSEYVSITYNDVCITYNDTGIAYPYAEEYIVFVDPNVEAVCATNWGDGVGIKPSQAAAVTSISQSFQNNTDITSFDEFQYFTGVTSMGSAFYGSSLTKITFPSSGMRTINNGSAWGSLFRNCTSLVEIDFGDFCRGSDSYNAQFQMFTNCSALTTIHFSSFEQMNYIVKHPTFQASDTIFGYNTNTHYVYLGGSELTSLVVPDGTTELRAAVCMRFNRLQSVSFPSTLTTIGTRAFEGCSALASVTIPSSVTSIGERAFAECRGITGFSSPVSLPLSAIISTGHKDGTLYINGDATGNGNLYIGYGKVIITGDFTGSSSGHQFGRDGTQEASAYDFVLKIGGNMTKPGTSGACFYNMNTVFFELGGQLTMESSTANFITNVKQGCIYHLAYNGIAGTVRALLYNGAAAVWGRIDKIYVGPGTSQAGDQAILDQYLADTDWAQYSSKLDIWYNYTGIYKEQ